MAGVLANEGVTLRMSDLGTKKSTDERQLLAFVAMMKQNSTRGVYSGFGTPLDRRYLAFCRQLTATGASLIFSRDKGMHSSGWWKSPDHEQCLHLSISYFDPTTQQHTGYHSKKRSKIWCDLFFGAWTRILWAEPPFSEEGKRYGTWHYRVFTDETFTIPILPRGEVYSKQFTELGWKSWSDLHGEPQEAAHT